MLAKKLNVSVEFLETGRDLRESEDRELRLGDAELAIRFSDDTGEIEQQLEELRDEALAAGDRLNAARGGAGRGVCFGCPREQFCSGGSGWGGAVDPHPGAPLAPAPFPPPRGLP